MKPKSNTGRRPKSEAIPAEGYRPKDDLGELLFGSVAIVPRKRFELLADQRARAAVASRIEAVLSEEDFVRQFPGASGGRAAELERVERWLEWHPDSPARILTRAWEEGGTKRAALLSKWLLICGKEEDREEARKWGKSARSVRESDLREFNKTGSFPLPNLNGTVTDSAFTFAMVVCGFHEPPLERGQKRSSLNRRLGEALAASFNQTSPQKISAAADRARKALSKLGFQKKSGSSNFQTVRK
jgi:hypothetical protein